MNVSRDIMSDIAAVMHTHQRRNYLLQYTVKPTTAKRYNAALLEFVAWCDLCGEKPTTVHDFDEMLMDYLHEIYEQYEGKGKSKANCTLFGILNRMPYLKGQLHSSFQVMRAWSKLSVGKSYPPITWELAVMVAVQMTRAGLVRYGIGVLVGFDCLLRVSELCGLLITDFADDGDERVSVEHQGSLLRLRTTKTGDNKFVSVNEPCVIQLIRWLLSLHQNQSTHGKSNNKRLIQSMKGRNNRSTSTTKHVIMSRTSSIEVKMDQHKLFPFTTQQFRNVFKSTCASLGLSNEYVPHSLRHGGATRYHHVKGWSIEDVLERGRWASVKSARRYIQSGVAKLMSMNAPKHISKIASQLASDPYHNIVSRAITTLSQKH